MNISIRLFRRPFPEIEFLPDKFCFLHQFDLLSHHGIRKKLVRVHTDSAVFAHMNPECSAGGCIFAHGLFPVSGLVNARYHNSGPQVTAKTLTMRMQVSTMSVQSNAQGSPVSGRPPNTTLFLQEQAQAPSPDCLAPVPASS